MSVVSKNLFDLLGNDESEDQPTVPVKTVDKTSNRTVKRNTDGEAPASKGPATSTRRGGFSGNEGGARGGRGARARGGRGASNRSNRDDRHSKTQPGGGSDKQAALAWGATEGEAEMKDEQAGEAIAQKDEKDAAAEDAQDPETPAEPEDKSVSYADYLAQQAEKKLSIANETNVRKANEGSKQNKQWDQAKELVKDDEGSEFIHASGGKARRERGERQVKRTINVDQRYVEPERPRGVRGGRGGPRGDSARGGGRGDSSRGGPRGGRGGPRGDFRGGRGGPSAGRAAQINTRDEKDFPSLGS